MDKEFRSRQVTSKLPPEKPNSSTPQNFMVHAFSNDLELNESHDLDSIPLKSFVVGVDSEPNPLSREEAEKFGDPFSKNILLRGKNPLTLSELVNEIASLKDQDALPISTMFLVAEGGQQKLREPNFDLNERLVFTWQKNESSSPDIFLSTVPVANSRGSLMQLIAWSESDKQFHFFERKFEWFWVGKSSFAFNSETRGKGPFDGHINGGLVMKELKFPWVHWHSQTASIPREAFGSESEFNTDPLFSIVEGAQVLESMVINGINRWYKSRLAKDITKQSPGSFGGYARQIVSSTSVNLISSSQEFRQLETETLSLPPSFFFDIDSLETCLSSIDPFNLYLPTNKVRIEGRRYLRAIGELEMHVVSNDPAVKIDGDTSFAFVVPERAFEDTTIIRLLINEGIISAKLALAILMVDFQNPIASNRRQELMKYFPDQITDEKIDDFFVNSVTDSNEDTNSNSPESEFLNYWRTENLPFKVKNELQDFVDGIQDTVDTEEGIKNLLLLAEQRKEFFRQKLESLDEFKSTLSKLNIEGPPVSIDKKGTIK